jgi:hypothetical protein
MTDEHATTEMVRLAKLRFGGDWLIDLVALCKRHVIDIDPMGMHVSDADTVRIVGILSGQLKGGEK